MFKMHYFSNKFLKIAKRWRLPALNDPAFDLDDLKLYDFANCSFSNWLWRIRALKNQLWRHSSDVIVITSLKNVTKLMSQDSSIMAPSQSKFLATSVRPSLAQG